MGRKKKFVVEIDEKYVDQKKTPNGNVHNTKSIWQKNSTTKHKKKIVGRLQATKTLAHPPPPPQISNSASLKHYVASVYSLY